MARKIRSWYKEWENLMVECCRCGEIKHSTDFTKASNGLFWLANNCRSCRKERYKKNRERVSQERKEYYQKVKEQKKEYQRQYYYKNDEHIKEQHKEYRSRNKEKIKEDSVEYYEKNKDAIIKSNTAYIADKTVELWFERDVFHHKARWQYKRYKLKPTECMICWNGWHIDAHHPSYDSFDKRKEVVFVCKSCHRNIHNWLLECPEPVDLIQLRAHMPEILTDKDLEWLKKSLPDEVGI